MSAYDYQEELIYAILAQCTRIKHATMKLIVKAEMGIAMTESCWVRAQEQLGKVREKPLTEKEEYLYALFSLFPDVRKALVNEKTKRYFNEETRGDRIEEIRAKAKTKPLRAEDAQEVLTEVQMRKHPEGGSFNLG